MQLTTERNRHIISGAIGLILMIALTTIGIKAAFGAFAGGYELHGEFSAAGQGLMSGSDVKIRGVNVGEVSGIELMENRAVVSMRIEDDLRVPETAQAVIRPKTLFGEKFVDILPGEDEVTGPYLDDGDEIEDTLGGFELEEVLSDAYPIIDAIDPAEFTTVLHELATAGDGLGENINRSIVNAAILTELQASNDTEIRQFLGDFALLSEEIDRLAPDLTRAARDLNVALPSLTARSDQLNTALVQLARLSGDVADLLENNEEFTTNALTNGSKGLQVLFDKRSRIQPLLLGLTQYTRTIAEALRIEVGDGTLMAAVKNLVTTEQRHEEEPEPEPGPGDPDDPTGILDGLPLEATPLAPATDELLDMLVGGSR